MRRGSAERLGNAHPVPRGAALVALPSRSGGMSVVIPSGAMARGTPIAVAADRGSDPCDPSGDRRRGLFVPDGGVGAPAEAGARIADPTGFRVRARRGAGGTRGFNAARWADGLRPLLTPPVSGRR